MERLAASELVADALEHYQADGNPLWVWLGIAGATDAGLAPPHWTHGYLAATARAITELARGPEKPDPGGLARALGLRGKGRSRTPFTELSIIRRDIALVEYVLALCNTPNPDKKRRRAFRVTAAVKRVAEQSRISEDTVWAAFRRYGKTLAASSVALVEDPRQ